MNIITSLIFGIFLGICIANIFFENMIEKAEERITRELEVEFVRKNTNLLAGYRLGLLECSEILYRIKNYEINKL